MKNEKSGAESFAENMREKLGLNKPFPKEVMDDLREDDQSKAIVITYLLGTLPMGLQKFIADQQQKIVVGLTAKNLAGEGPEAMLGMLLMGAMLGDKDSDE